MENSRHISALCNGSFFANVKGLLGWTKWCCSVRCMNTLFVLVNIAHSAYINYDTPYMMVA